MTGRRAVALLAALVAARMAFHALFVPAFEGPDEPAHLSRALAVVRGLPADRMPGDVVAAVASHPCGPPLSRAYGCPPFGGRRAAFNVLRRGDAAAPAPDRKNYETHQPPLYYLVAGALLRLLPGAGAVADLLALRLLSLALVLAALFGPLASLSRDHPPGAAAAALLALLAPGAAEALSRGSNDALLFFWCAATVWAVRRGAAPAWIVLLLAAGPLVKLTAFPVAAFAVVELWRRRGARWAGAGALSAAAVFPVQAWRGWSWGGTYEMNRAGAGWPHAGLHALVGLLKSLAVFGKTIFWLGEWSTFREPRWLEAGTAALLLAAALSLRRRRGAPLAPHGAALAVALAGILVFAVGNRRFWGVWGGFGGWYAWGWLPWLALAGAECLRLAPRARRPLLGAAVAACLLVNGFWFAEAVRLYGVAGLSGSAQRWKMTSAAGLARLNRPDWSLRPKSLQ